MIVAALLLILAMLFYLRVPSMLNRSHDARRKADLHEYRTVMEEYFTDKHRYPPAGTLDNCRQPGLEPYIDRITCDPQTGDPYRYIVSEDGLRYWLYTNLADLTDPVIAERGCDLGCGPDDDNSGNGDYNYGVSSEQAVVGEFTDRTTSPPSCPQGCAPGACGTCCPGAKNRCSTTGSSCYTDYSCP
jgi:type II secretory pathway pseudopilin PulG